MTRAHDEQGFVLVTAIILLSVMLGLGIALVALANDQQTASAREQASEAAFNLAEAALNAQTLQLSREWPGRGTSEPTLQRTCTATTSASTNYCPEPIALEKAYPSTGSTSCAGTEAWNTSLGTNKWVTYVREDVSGSPYFNSTTESTANAYDGGRTVEGVVKPWDKLWVRAVGVVDCHAVAVVSLVSEQLVHTVFPEGALSANWFETGNEGNKVIIKHAGKAQTGKFSIRCQPPRTAANCEKYRKAEEKNGKHSEGQIQPELTTEEREPSSASSTTLSTEQLEALRSQAKSEGHFYSSSNCPSTMTALSGRPTYVEGCALKLQGGTANSSAEPGFLVLANGTINLDGGATFYGVVYDADLQKSSEVLVVVKGASKIVGEILVDGQGGIELGDKGHEVVAFEYDPSAAEKFETVTGAAATRNSFRTLPANQ